MKNTEKFGFDKIIFKDLDSLRKFVSDFGTIYSDYIYKIDDEKVEGNGLFGTKSFKERKKYKTLKISMDIYTATNSLDIFCYGDIRYANSIYRFLQSLYYDGVIIDYSFCDDKNKNDSLKSRK